jgi:hypothetical protein
MVNTNFAISGTLGTKLNEDLTPAEAANGPALGTTVKGNNGSEWMRVVAGSTIAPYNWVAIQASCTAVPGTTALARTGAISVGIAQNAITSGNYGWVAINGQSLTVSTLAAEGVGVQLFTTDTAGTLADATASASQVPILGLTLTATASGTTASSAACILQNPVVRKTIDAN